MPPPTIRGRRRSIDAVTAWLLLVAALVVVMVLVGGFTRLSRAGLSIVEWDPVAGVLPPIGQQAWQESFTLYQQTPEYQLVNQGMSLADYQSIFYIEWFHRLLGRVAGLLVVFPLLWFMVRRRLTLRESVPYWGVVALFGLQGAVGWVMVASGLVDRPAVSHIRLTIHLLTALTLLAVVVWMALNRIRAARGGEAAGVSQSTRRWAWIVFSAVVIQIGWGGFVAGLKAGHVSDTWPLMFGRWVPAGLLARSPWWVNFFEAVGSHWFHRWFAFVVLTLAVVLARKIYRDPAATRALRSAAWWLPAVVSAQIVLGVGVVLFGVPKWLALTHQATAVAVFITALVIAHGTYSRSKAGSMAPSAT